MPSTISYPACGHVFPLAEQPSASWFKCPNCPAKVVNLNVLVTAGGLAVSHRSGLAPASEVSGCTVALSCLGTCLLGILGPVVLFILAAEGAIWKSLLWLVGGGIFWIGVPLLTLVLMAKIKGEKVTSNDRRLGMVRTMAVVGMVTVAGFLYAFIACPRGLGP